MYRITLIPGDGIGPSIVDAAVQVIEATGVKITWDRQLAGMDWDNSEAHSAIYDAEQTTRLFCGIVNRWQALQT